MLNFQNRKVINFPSVVSPKATFFVCTIFFLRSAVLEKQGGKGRRTDIGFINVDNSNVILKAISVLKNKLLTQGTGEFRSACLWEGQPAELRDQSYGRVQLQQSYNPK
jgi:hypothetical protein